MLDGEYGEAVGIAMRVLTRLGDVYGAKRMIEVSSGHSVSFIYNCGYDALVESNEKLVSMGAKVKVPTTMNVGSATSENPKDFRIPKNWVDKHKRLEAAGIRMGAIPSWSCIPYFYENVPKFGENVVWAESNCVSYVNSVIGARTNRYTGFVDLFGAIAGRVPGYGLHIGENRFAKIAFELKIKPKDFRESDYPLLGYLVGEKTGERIPLIIGLPKSSSRTQLASLGAAAASSGSVALYHVLEVTPEAKTLKQATGGDRLEEKCSVFRTDLEKIREKLNTAGDGNVDFVSLGCPHYNVEQIARVARLIEGKKVHDSVEMWISTSRLVKQLLERMGLTSILRSSGVKILTDSCPANGPSFVCGFKTMMTDSAKMAHYGPMQVKAETIYGSTEQCVEAAVKGEFKSN